MDQTSCYNHILLINNINSDPDSNQALQDEIKLLNEKLDYLNEGSRRLHGLYDKSLEEKRNLKTQVGFQIDASRSASAYDSPGVAIWLAMSVT